MLLEVKNLKKYFPLKQGVFGKTYGVVKAVDDISFSIHENEVLGLVGESGCGKSTAGKSILRLIKPTGGTILFNSVDLSTVHGSSRKEMCKNIQIIFQDPLSALDPKMTIGDILLEPLQIHNIGTKATQEHAVLHLLERVGLHAHCITNYPHEFSGGQAQRIGIIRALLLNPQLIIADEPVSALDISIQAQIINLLIDLKKEFTLSYLFISHDLRVVRYISDRIAVMYLGKVLEIGPAADVCDSPLHPYTKALLSCVPVPVVQGVYKKTVIKGDVPSPAHPPSGCSFHPRCIQAHNQCTLQMPELLQKSTDRYVRCPYV